MQARLLLLSDLHLEFADFAWPAGLDHSSFDAVVLAGDIMSPGRRVPDWARRTFGEQKPVVFVPGNHEYYGCEYFSELAAMRDACLDADGQATNVHLLNEDELIIQLPGGMLRFLGATLWTDFAIPVREPESLNGQPIFASDVGRALEQANRSLNDFHSAIRFAPPELKAARSVRASVRLFTAEDSLALHHRQRNWLERQVRRTPADDVRATVVVTHHGCSSQSVAKRWVDNWLTPAFSSELPGDFFSMGIGPPELWVHGHTHDSHNYYRKSTQVVVNPRGYPLRSQGTFENPNFNPALVVHLDMQA